MPLKRLVQHSMLGLLLSPVVTGAVGCGGANDASQAETPSLTGEYTAQDADTEVVQITFYGTSGYHAFFSSCAGSGGNECFERGTYSISPTGDALLLRNEATGATTSLPYKQVQVGGDVPTLTSEELPTLGEAADGLGLQGTSLGPADGGVTLTRDAGPLVRCSQSLTSKGANGPSGVRITQFKLGSQQTTFQAAPAFASPSTCSQSDAGAGTTQIHQFTIQTKLFIANIPSNMLGSLLTPVSTALLAAFRVVTNAAYSENPPDGTPGTAMFRVYSMLNLNVICNGSQIHVTNTGQSSAAGKEGPFNGTADPPVSLLNPDGHFYMQVDGYPALAAEPAFQAIQTRTSRTVWNIIAGQVTCDASGNATLALDPSNTIHTPFPSYRVWVTHTAPTGPVNTQLAINTPQGVFSNIWYLPPVPSAPLSIP